MSLIPLEINGTREASAIAKEMPAKTTIENSNIQRLMVTLEPCLGANGPVGVSGSDTNGFLGLSGDASCLNEQFEKQIVMLSGSQKRLLSQEPAKLDWLRWLTNGSLHFHSELRDTIHYSPISRERS